ncbi:hypothetical protein RvY_10779 [Ramazzottius varieornatus]|uniref:Uncharacterized protein n=1 Tax=Ramazzottius varieornatus TaxID=947166 RepID=A0A1D1VMW0_RAMVA|nr:hypothetical protein RvY_10779 [Ramazzottius varieornatus]
MPLRSGRVLKLPRESSTTVPSKNKKEPKKKKQGTTPVEPASVVSPVRSPSPPIVLPSPPAPVLPLPTATAQTIPGEENFPPPVASTRFKRLNAKVTKTWLLGMFELDASTDVDRDGAIDCLFAQGECGRTGEGSVDQENSPQSGHQCQAQYSTRLRTSSRVLWD